MIKNVGIAEIAFSDSSDDTLVAPHLGSCLGIAVWDEKLKKAGLIHCLLPLSKSDPKKAKANPCMYVDTGVANLLKTMIRNGSNKKDLIIRVSGGAQMGDVNNTFQIGKKNYTIFRKIMWKNNLLIQAEHVGKNCSRTMSLYVADGHVTVKIAGEEIKLK